MKTQLCAGYRLLLTIHYIISKLLKYVVIVTGFLTRKTQIHIGIKRERQSVAIQPELLGLGLS